MRAEQTFRLPHPAGINSPRGNRQRARRGAAATGAGGGGRARPRYGVPKPYRALVRGILDEALLDRGRRALLKELRKADRQEGRVIPTGAGAAPVGFTRLEMAVVGYEQGQTVLRIIVRDGRS